MLPDPATFMKAQKRREITLVLTVSMILLAIAAGLRWYATMPSREQAVEQAAAPVAAPPETPKAPPGGRGRRASGRPGSGIAASAGPTRAGPTRAGPACAAPGQGAGNAAASRR